MALHGLDRAQAPPADKAKAMLEKVQGSWWNVYIGGPRRNPAAASWTPDRVREYEAQGITRFLLIYVGRQQDDVPLLTTTQGRHDGDEACQIATHFGYGAGTPICLDLEARTFDASNRGSLVCRTICGRKPASGPGSTPANSTRSPCRSAGWTWTSVSQTAAALSGRS